MAGRNRTRGPTEYVYGVGNGSDAKGGWLNLRCFGMPTGDRKDGCDHGRLLRAVGLNVKIRHLYLAVVKGKGDEQK